MIKAAILSVALLAALSSQAHAQAAVEDPGYCAQYYPSANCNNYGPGNPMYPGSYRPSGSYHGAYSGPYAAAVAPVVVHRHRRQHHRH